MFLVWVKAHLKIALVDEQVEWYAGILENVPLIWPKSLEFGLPDIFGNAANQNRGSKSIRKLVDESKQPIFVRSLNSSGLLGILGNVD